MSGVYPWVGRTVTAHLIGGPRCGETEDFTGSMPEYVEGGARGAGQRYLRARTLPPWMRKHVPGRIYYLWEGLFIGAT